MKTSEIVLKQRLDRMPQETDFTLIERDVGEDLATGQLLVRTHYLSLDPYMGQAIYGRHMGEPHPGPGDPLPGFSVGEVIASKDDRFAEGDLVVGKLGWAEAGVLEADQARRVDASLGTSIHLGLLGMPGLTAWAGVTQLLKIGAGDVFTLDAAAGAVGGTAGQLARILGAKAIGIAGGPDKCALVRDIYGFDDCVDYKDIGWVEALKIATDGGPTAHFENVGLSTLMPVLGMLRDYGRVVLCGLAEHYHQDGPKPSIPIGSIMMKRAQVLGLIVYDFAPRWAEWTEFARPHLKSGMLVEHNDVSDGLASAPAQFARLLAGQNRGKTLVRTGG